MNAYWLAELSPSLVSIQCISNAFGFRALKDEWMELYCASIDTTLFNSWEWLFSWWQAYHYGKSLRLLIVRELQHNRLLGIIPLYLVTERKLRTNCRVLRFIGDGTYDSDYLNFLIRRDATRVVLEKLSEWLLTSDHWDAIVLKEVQEHTGLPVVFRELAANQCLAFRQERTSCGFVELPASFGLFVQTRQPRFRTKLRALLRAFETDSSLVFEDHCSSHELKRKLRSLFDLHQVRWQHNLMPGVFNDKSKRRFYSHFATRFARNSWLRLFSLRQGERYLAHQLCFGAEGKTYLLQEGFDISDPSKSYGQMLRALVIRHLIERGEHRYDFLGGLSHHKETWGAKQGDTLHFTISRKNWRGWLYFHYPLLREQIKVMAKRFVPQVILRMRGR